LIEYPTRGLFTSEPCQYDLTRDFIYPLFNLSNRMSSPTAHDDRFSLELLAPIGDVGLDIGT
jgi:hypothetical protein